MPIGTRSWRWFEPRLRSGSAGTKAGFGALLVCAGFVYVFFGPLVFDASYWVLGKIARGGPDRRLRVGASIALVVVYLAVLGVYGSTATGSPAAGSPSTPLLAASAVSQSASPTAATSPTPTAPASPSPTAAPITVFPSAVASSVDVGAWSPAREQPMLG